MFANCQLGGLNFAFPDVCLTPILVPVPIPYPNFSFGPTAIPTAPNILMSCAPGHNIMTITPLSLGDTPGVNLGVASGMVMGPTRHLLGSFGVFLNGPPAAKMLGLTGQNGFSPNMVGLTLAPSQVCVLIVI
jgi:hypothetical protein